MAMRSCLRSTAVCIVRFSYRRTLECLQVQVNLKSTENLCFKFSMDSVLTIGEVARRSGVASSALRFYEERGLISSVRAGSGHRRYPRSALRRIAFIVFAQKIGFSLEEIGAELAKLPSDRIPTRADWTRLSGAWTERIDQRIAELQRLRAGLTQCIGMRMPLNRQMPARKSGRSSRSPW